MAEIAEAVANKLEEERKEAEFDREHNNVKGKIQEITIELTNY